MQINPEDYLDVEALEFLGPNALKQQQQVPPTPAAPVPTEGPERIFAIQEQLFAAQRSGNNAQITLLSMQLDDALQSQPQAAPQGTPEASGEEKELPKTTSSQEQLEADYNASEVKAELTNKFGPAEVNRVHEWANENLSEEELGEYLGLIGSDNPEAILAFDSLKTMASDSRLAPSVEEYTTFSDQETHALISQYGDHGEIVVNLNNQYMSGQITESEMKRAVLSDPTLALSVFQMKRDGLIDF